MKRRFILLDDRSTLNLWRDEEYYRAWSGRIFFFEAMNEEEAWQEVKKDSEARYPHALEIRYDEKQRRVSIFDHRVNNPTFRFFELIPVKG